jgi:RNA polymerase sigma-70 factor (ECF subfamily)
MVLRPREHYPDCPEAMMVGLAQSGDRAAFEEIVRRRQSSVRNLMRRCCFDPVLADDLAQQVFLQVWLKLGGLREINAFGGWLKRIAISIWLQHQRKKDALNETDELSDLDSAQHDSPDVGMDLDRALVTLPATVRICVVLSYQEGMSHGEIAELLDIPLGTVKSHIRRGTDRLRKILSAYSSNPEPEGT